MAVELSGGRPGSDVYLRFYKRALSKVEANLTPADRQMYREKAKKWTEKRLPSRMQQRYVHRNFWRLELKLFRFSH